MFVYQDSRLRVIRLSIRFIIVGRELVATQQNSGQLGLILVAQACDLGFLQATRRGFFGDGSNWLWTTYEQHFMPVSFTPILDMRYAIQYI